MTPRVAITGYASLDHVAILDGAPLAGRTTTILDRPPGAWPRLGGSPAYVAAALVANGVAEAVPVSWLADDEAGALYRRQLVARDIPDDGLAVVAGARTPVAILAYEPEGGCHCLYHPGMPAGLTLSPGQRGLIAAAPWVCVTIGPPAASEAVLDAIGPVSKLAWIVKHDPRAMGPELARRMAARADVVFLSLAEADFLAQAHAGADARPDQIVIETHGRRGAALRRDGETTFVPTEPLAVADPTGAGDTFAGGALAAMIAGIEDPETIIAAGHRAAGALLTSRQPAPESASI